MHYWRDKAGHELDFVLVRGRDAVDAIECKWNPGEFDAGNLRVLRTAYPHGKNYLVSPISTPAHRRRFGDLEVKVCAPAGVAG